MKDLSGKILNKILYTDKYSKQKKLYDENGFGTTEDEDMEEIELNLKMREEYNKRKGRK